MERSRHKIKEPDLFITRLRSNKHLSSMQPQFFRCKQLPGESLEQIHSRIKQKAAFCNWEDIEESLVRSMFIQGMSNQQIQMDLISEDRDPLETLIYALTRERRQEN